MRQRTPHPGDGSELIFDLITHARIFLSAADLGGFHGLNPMPLPSPGEGLRHRSDWLTPNLNALTRSKGNHRSTSAKISA